MEVRAVGRGFRVQPRKVRIVADEVRGKHAVLALAQLRYHKSKGARMLHKVLRSAVGNAMENSSLSPETLVITRIEVDEGMRLKRIRARAQGRANRILKRSSHITVILEEREPFKMNKSNAKPLPRPKFDAPKPKKEAKAKVEKQPVEAVVSEEVVVVEEAVAEEPVVEEVVVEETATTDTEAPEGEKA